MKRKWAIALACAITALALPAGSTDGYNAAVSRIVNPSGNTGGTLVFDDSGDWDSIDPGNTYVAYSWDFARLYARTLTTYAAKPGLAGEKLVPDLARSLGQVSNNGLTWTYHLKSNVRMEDGETVTSQMIKYAIERTASYSSTLPIGPVYWGAFLTDPHYPGAFNDTSPGKLGLGGISTPDTTTIVFHLSKPMAEFDNLVSMPEAAPVPPAKDTGVHYYQHPLSSGPYVVQSYIPGQHLVLVKNPQWNPSTDPVRKQLATKIVVNLNVNADEIDNRLFAGDTDMAVEGGGVQSQGQAKIFESPALQRNADNPINGFDWYAAISTVVPPLNNVNCRQAVEYAADHAALQNAFGGAVGGEIAPTMLPPTIPGALPASYDPYEFLSKPHGDLQKARAALMACGHPNGFTTTISYRNNRPKEEAAAVALQNSLAQVGIKADLFGFPSGEIDVYPGTPDFVHQRGLGINVTGWGSDWPSGFGYLYSISAGNAIQPTSNSNISELNDPKVNSLLNAVMATRSPSARAVIYGRIEKQITQDAAFLPIVYSRSLLYRNPNVTNVYVNPALQMYDYAQLGLTKLGPGSTVGLRRLFAKLLEVWGLLRTMRRRSGWRGRARLSTRRHDGASRHGRALP
jgi:peptide/nickel transport system substrate-binding protein